MSKSNFKNAFNYLPSGTNVDNLLLLISVLGKNNKNEETVKALFGKGDTAYSNTKSALRAFRIIENDSLNFTTIGREIAFSIEDDKKDEIEKIVRSYEPYELVLQSIATSRNDVNVTDIDAIKNLWGKAEYGSGDRNRNDGATLFMSIIEYIEFGKYIIGRGNNSTRIEWTSNIKNTINSLFQKGSIIEKNEPTNSQSKDDIKAIAIEEQGDIPSAVNIVDGINAKPINKSISAIHLPNISINVDMSNWSEEKMIVFFKCAYGIFKED